jgi:putative peptidoglycan lipid II flippase
VRVAVIGRQFGISPALDAFNAANNIPDLLFAMISGGALSLAFIPVLAAVLERDGRPALWALFSRVANLVFLTTAVLAVVVALLAEPLVRSELGVAPGFNTEMQSLVVQLMRLNLVATLLFSMSGLVVAGLQANKSFFLPALAPVAYDVGQIFGALVLAPSEPVRLGPFTLPAAGLGVHGLVYGVILGAGLHLAVQIPGLIRYRFRWTAVFDWRDAGVLRVARLLGPRILTIGAFQLIFIIQDNLASRLEVGSVTALTYGWLIAQFPKH